MSVDRGQLYKLIEEYRQSYQKIFDYIISLKEEECIVEADNSPLTHEERKAISRADQDITKGELVDWEDIHNELGL